MVQMCSTNPARIFGLKERGTLKAKAHADMTILDPQFEWVFDVNRYKIEEPKHAIPRTLDAGCAVATIVGGRLVYLHPDYGRVTEEKASGLCKVKLGLFEIPDIDAVEEKYAPD